MKKCKPEISAFSFYLGVLKFSFFFKGTLMIMQNQESQVCVRLQSDIGDFFNFQEFLKVFRKN